VGTQLHAQPATKTRAGPRAKFAAIDVTESSREVRSRNFIKPGPLLVDHAGLSREQWHHVATRHVTENRDQFVRTRFRAKVGTVIGLVVER